MLLTRLGGKKKKAENKNGIRNKNSCLKVNIGSPVGPRDGNTKYTILVLYLFEVFLYCPKLSQLFNIQ